MGQLKELTGVASGVVIDKVVLGGAVEVWPVERADGVASGVVIDKVVLGGALKMGQLREVTL